MLDYSERRAQLEKKKKYYLSKLKIVEGEIRLIDNIEIEKQEEELANILDQVITGKNHSKFKALNRFMIIFKNIENKKSIHKSKIYKKYRELYPEEKESSMRSYFHRFCKEGLFIAKRRNSDSYILSEDLVKFLNMNKE